MKTTTTKTKTFPLGTIEATGADLAINLPELVVSRALIQANSGGGKSRLIRRLLEQTHGRIQQLVIDIEGEFASLREHYDYVLAAKTGGDTVVDPRGAALLAERLLELKASAILDIYELPHRERILFVQRFLDSLVNAPKHLWHPVLVIIDEAHVFCPQEGKTETGSADAVMDICTRGRKRGFCTVLATQRLSKLHKDAAAECNNKFIGRSSLDVDMKRAGMELGFSTREQLLTLRGLEPGEFYAFGPAVSRDVVKMRGGPVVSTHPTAGHRVRFIAPKPTKAILALLPKLADLPVEAEQRAKTQRELERQVHDLTRQLAAAARAVPKPAPPPPAPTLSQRELNTIHSTVGLTKRAAQELILTSKRIARMSATVDAIAERFNKVASTNAVLKETLVNAVSDLTNVRVPISDYIAPPRAESQNGDARVQPGSSAWRLLVAVKSYPRAPQRRIAAIARVPIRLSTYRVAIAKLKREGLIVDDGEGFSLTMAGEQLTQHVKGAPTGGEGRQYWLSKLGGLAREMFRLLTDNRDGLTTEQLAELTNKSPAISTFRVAIGRLRQHDLIERRHDRYVANSEYVS